VQTYGRSVRRVHNDVDVEQVCRPAGDLLGYPPQQGRFFQVDDDPLQQPRDGREQQPRADVRSFDRFRHRDRPDIRVGGKLTRRPVRQTRISRHDDVRRPPPGDPTRTYRARAPGKIATTRGRHTRD